MEIEKPRYLVTGGAGFIGSHLVRSLVHQGYDVLCFDKLGYAGHAFTLDDLIDSVNLQWRIADLLDEGALQQAFEDFRPTGVFHLAAESHVDRSIRGPATFAKNNVVGTVHLLEAARNFIDARSAKERDLFRIVYLSTDEVFGSIDSEESGAFTEQSHYRPNSPYSASKAAADHFANAFRSTYGLALAIVHSSNNYGSHQHPEKLIPNSIQCAIEGKPIPLYGDGMNVRDWLHVSDHIRGLQMIMHATDSLFCDYVIGGNAPCSNLQIVESICSILSEVAPSRARSSYRSLITYVADRPGHDRKYFVDASFLRKNLGWKPQVEFQSGLRQLIEWQLSNQSWIQRVKDRGAN